MIVEYMGETVRGPVADLRERVYEEQAVGSCYLFRLDRLEVRVFGRLGVWGVCVGGGSQAGGSRGRCTASHARTHSAPPPIAPS